MVSDDSDIDSPGSSATRAARLANVQRGLERRFDGRQAAHVVGHVRRRARSRLKADARVARSVGAGEGGKCLTIKYK